MDSLKLVYLPVYLLLCARQRSGFQLGLVIWGHYLKLTNKKGGSRPADNIHCGPKKETGAPSETCSFLLTSFRILAESASVVSGVYPHTQNSDHRALKKRYPILLLLIILIMILIKIIIILTIRIIIMTNSSWLIWRPFHL